MMGSFLDQSRLPDIGARVWFLHGFDEQIGRGQVVNVYDIDQHGLANTYLDIQAEHLYHTTLSTVYDHRPTRQRVQDAFGDVEVWQ